MEIHCTNPECLFFKNKKLNHYKKKGHYKTKSGIYQRYECKLCRTSFSERTFSIDYWLHYSLNYQELAKKIFSSGSVRSIALDYQHSPASISRRVQRLSRNITAATYELEKNHKLCENLCADGIQNFNVSQFYPCDYNILVGEKSQHIYVVTYSLFKRKGRMSKYQKKLLPHKYKGVNYNDFSTIQGFNYLVEKLETLLKSRNNDFPFTFHTDKKIEYSLCLKQSSYITHLQYLNQFKHHTTSSKNFRDTKNKLFPVNYIDRELRKNLGDMERETTRWARNVCMALDRINIFAFYHNNIKKFRIKDPVGKNHIRHSHIAGIQPEAVDKILNVVFDKRFFYTDYKNLLGSFNKLLWERKIPTPKKIRKEYLPAFALI